MASSDGQNGMGAVPPAILCVLASQPSFLREDDVAASGGQEVAVLARPGGQRRTGGTWGSVLCVKADWLY
jgi:hypothetical protein